LIVDSLNEIDIIISNDLTPPSPHTSNIPITINISQQQSNQAASAITVLIQTANDNMNDLEAVSSDDDEHQQRAILNEQQRNPLTIQERKKIHNRSKTLKQRQRSYKHEIVQRDIDKRFTITDIKNILRQHSIKLCAINTSVSPTTNKKSLYIGIKNKNLLSNYKEQTKQLFTTTHYKQYKHVLRSSNYKDDRRNGYQRRNQTS
ncbi:unnamed protein product, partial [Rotaria sp. Silwood2]